MARSASSSFLPPQTSETDSLAWFEELEDNNEDSDTEVEEAPEQLQAEASEALVEYLSQLQTKGKIHANDFCIIAHYAVAAGATGETLKKVSMPAGKPSGSYSRHLTRALRLTFPVPPYDLVCPGHKRHESGRVEVTIPCLPLHELLTSEVAEFGSDDLTKAQFPVNFQTHPVVESHPGEEVWPLALYLDGVPVTKRDGLLVITLKNLASERKWLVAAVKRSSMCRCGCRGWCTLFHIMAWLRYCLEALSQGEMPTTRADGSAFLEGEVSRQELGGKPCAIGALCQIKGDWAEFAHTLGFPTWSAKWNPCLFCKSSHADLGAKLLTCSQISSPWPDKTPADLDEYCSEAELEFKGSLEEWQSVMPLLQYDTRKKGNRGRCLARPVPAMGLLAGDRLEPSKSCPDIGLSLKDVSQAVPKPVTFWRVRQDEPCRHRNPLWSIDLGVTTDIVCIDVMHTLCLGIYTNFLNKFFWHVLHDNVYKVPAFFSQEERHVKTLQRMSAELRSFYKKAGKTWTQVDELRVEMLGSKGASVLHFKAHQTLGLLFFAETFLTEHEGLTNQYAWKTACSALTGLWLVFEKGAVELQDHEHKDTHGLLHQARY